MSEVDLRRQLAAARQDIDGFVEEIRGLNDRLEAKDAEIARLTRELARRTEVSR